MDSSQLHKPVLLDETLKAISEHFDSNESFVGVDGTFGRGGHSAAILNLLDGSGKLYGIDKDPEAIAVGKMLQGMDPRFEIIHSSFASISSIAKERNILLRMSVFLRSLMP